MTKMVHGVVHGRIIELDEELGVAEGRVSQFKSKCSRRNRNGAMDCGDVPAHLRTIGRPRMIASWNKSTTIGSERREGICPSELSARHRNLFGSYEIVRRIDASLRPAC